MVPEVESMKRDDIDTSDTLAELVDTVKGDVVMEIVMNNKSYSSERRVVVKWEGNLASFKQVCPSPYPLQ